ncbi:MAG: M3 family oligoendopeptidase [Candidatus Mcinerneyibacterium aminivorans]|uniref:M3 family oligoendopeptidase n=1 Tax=Candidatus Mcinerneyibacterium aminivorans TaxID=2703815 RepID=A0A5D0MLD6_9BACT|nr:MAG: M3 family oligoendopeptidase [Candidatus Mcinerneyibacterium aminivorans]
MKKLNDMAKNIREHQIMLSKLNWTNYTTGFDFGIQQAQKDLIEYYKDKNNYNYILKKEKEVSDELNKRKVKIMKDMFEKYHLSDELNDLRLEIRKLTTDLSKILNNFRYEIDDKKVTSVDIYQILTTNEDEELRKKAYMSRKQINKPLVERGFIELLNLRKQFAEKSGYKDFVEYKLDEQELSTEIFNNWINETHEILPAMKDIRKKYAKKYLNKAELKPWDEAYLNGKISPVLKENINMLDYYEILSKFFNKFGIDLEQYNITYDIFSRNNKSEWGYNFPIEYGEDSRILANVKNMYNEFGVLLHETGHGIHSFKIDPEERILNFGISGIIFEGIANLFGSFLYDEFFYKDIIERDIEKINNQMRNLKKWNKINNFGRIPDILFDQRLYLNDVKNLDDINNLYWNTYDEVLQEGPYAKQPIWGYRIHHTTHPIYLHNYLMGDVTYKMFKSVFNNKNNIDRISEKPKKFIEFLERKVIEPSGKYPYEKLFKHISQEKFSLKYLK